MVKIGFIGTARRAKGHLDSLRGMDDVKIAAQCDIIRERAEEAAHTYGGNVYTDYRDMLSKEDLNAVYIVTPPKEHTVQAIDAASSGAHVFLEKPISLSLPDAFAIKEAFDSAGLICSVGYQLRYLDTVDLMRDILKGHPIAMLSGHYYWTVPPLKWVMDRDLTGGQIVEQATHTVDLFRFIAGEVKAVYARYTLKTRLDVPGFNNWDANALTLEFENGAVGSLVSTYALFPGIPDGSSFDVIADELLLRFSGSELKKFTRDGTEAFTPEVDPTKPANEAFMNFIKTGNTSPIRSPIDDSILTLAVTLAANRSAMTGRPVNIKDFMNSEFDK